MNLNIFALKKNALDSESGEAILGSQETGSHACYLIYGVLKPGEKGRVVKPGKGHEEIILAMKGALNVSGHYSGYLQEGSAFHVSGEDTCYLENPEDSDAVYIIAGGHSGSGHH
ncbi:MAG: hypothetical protein AB1552_00920 [Nitrospirota bacterium]